MTDIERSWDDITGDLSDLRERTERAFLGAMLLRGTVGDDLRRVKPKHFQNPVHSQVWLEMLKRPEFDRLLLAGYLAEAGRFSETSALTLLASLEDEIPAADLIPYYALRVIEGWTRATIGKAKP